MIEKLNKNLIKKFGKTEKTADLISFYFMLETLGFEVVKNFYLQPLLDENINILTDLKFYKQPENADTIDKVSSINVKALKQFIVFAEARDFNTAIKLLNVSPQVLSRSISSIEKQYKVKLLERKKHAKTLTEVGNTFLQKAYKLLHNLYNLEKISNEIINGNKKEELFIKVSAPWNSSILANITARFKQNFPETYINISGKFTKNSIEKALLLYEIDLGLLTEKPANSEIEFIEIINMPVILACHPQSAKKWQNLFYINPEIEDYPEENLDFTKVIGVKDIYLSMELCKNGTGVAYFPKIIIQEEIDKGLLTEIETPNFKRKIITLFIAWNKNIILTPYARQFIYELKKYFENTNLD